MTRLSTTVAEGIASLSFCARNAIRDAIGIEMSTDILAFLQFPLTVEDDWPPVSSESISFEKKGSTYRALSAPLFVGNLSVGDVIRATEDSDGFVKSWGHVQRSDRTTIWLLRLSENGQISHALEAVHHLGCNTVGLPKFGCYSIDVPENVLIHDVDCVLNALDPSCTAVAFPSMRHPD